MTLFFRSIPIVQLQLLTSHLTVLYRTQYDNGELFIQSNHTIITLFAVSIACAIRFNMPVVALLWSHLITPVSNYYGTCLRIIIAHRDMKKLCVGLTYIIMNYDAHSFFLFLLFGPKSK